MKNKVYLMLLSFSLFTGATFHAAKYAVQYFSAFSAAAWRFGLAAVVMLLIFHVKEKNNRETWKENGMMFVLLGLIGVFGFNAFFFIGLNSTSPINGALIMATNPLVTTVLARYLLHTPITKRQAIGVFFSLAGVVFVITGGAWEVIANLSFSMGDIYILLGNLCWALYGILTKRYVKNSSALATTTNTMVAGAIGLIVVSAFYTNPVPLTEIPVAAWAAILFMSLFTTVLGYLLWNQAISQIGASKASVFFNLVPVVTMLMSLAMGAEVTWVQLSGAALVLTGVVIASGNSRRRITALQMDHVNR